MDTHTVESGGGDERRSSTSFEDEFGDEVTQNIRVPPMMARGTMARPAEPRPTPEEIGVATGTRCSG